MVVPWLAKLVRGTNGFMDLYGDEMENLNKFDMCDYPLVNVYITMENHHFQWVNPL